MDKNSDRNSTNMSSLKIAHIRRNERDDYNLRFDADYDYLLKMVIVGDSCVGKSVLMRRYIDGDYPIEPYVSTIGVDFCVDRLEIDNSDSKIKFTLCNNSRKKVGQDQLSPNPFKVKLQVWDTAGQERFRSITQSYYRGMRMCVLCFDSTKAVHNGSITGVMKWLDEIEKHAGTDIRVYVVGTKIDSQDTLMFNSDKLFLESHIKEIESGTDLEVKFCGWCSSKNDIFLNDLSDVKHIVKGADSYYWSADKVEECPELEGHTVPTIRDMFRDIVFDFLHREAKLSEHVQIRLYDHDTEEFFVTDDGEDRRSSCCVIL